MKNYSGIRGFIKKLSYKYDKTKKVDSRSELALHWWNGRVNLGDVVNKYIVEQLSGKSVVWSSAKSNQEHYLVIGSVLQSCNDNAVVWGSGIISDKKNPLFKPKKVYAVRGPKTREVLLSRGIKCPEIYGDPALILPTLIKPNIADKRYKLGIIPHYKNKNDGFFNRALPGDVKIIDIETDNIQKFVDDIVSCDLIVSSSLHGIIISDAYGIPAHHVCFDEIITGGEFKFFDYYLSVGRECTHPIKLSISTNLDELYSLPKDYNLSIDIVPLLNSCPFK
ncbi:polysaccharide pyruvyl transferase family protein [Vibrio celticus]|uniref:Exopolysaccharide glucosyl ketal-pyruvate-transferase n=1 Tax=Vibrio celticus TaxID=446372 RepID=A0A1C3JC64_9VIBR|nr:polysaccharide pyruvyl transferase family protein [Vibrio celticus]SBT12666.1 Exopolysaccharide glucosyl ketal-pyruvate-transferase [Vibrio celticus]